MEAIVEQIRTGVTAASAGMGDDPVGATAGCGAASALREIVARALPVLLALPGADSDRSAAPGRWSPREVVGHLVDSAWHNHRRFLEARWRDDLVFEGYDQEAWVAAQRYAQAPWVDLVELWRAVNLHVARVMDTTPEAERTRVRAPHSLDRIAFRPVRADEPTSLEFLMDDYVAHLLHHLRQVLGQDWRPGPPASC